MLRYLLAFVVFVAACGDSVTTTSAAVDTAATRATEAAATTQAPPTEAPPPDASTTTTLPPVTTSTSATTTTIDPNAPVVVELAVASEAVDGPGRVEVERGRNVQLQVSSDTADEVHVHGYDIYADVDAGGMVTIGFEASIQGIFEVELEDSGVLLLELVVE